MDEGRVNHTVRSGRSATQAIEIFERTAVYIGSCRSNRGGGGIRASEAEHLISCIY